jgi:hypothetical protein
VRSRQAQGGEESVEVLALYTCLRVFEGGNEIRSVNDKVLGSNELQACPFISHAERVRGFVREVGGSTV